MYAMLTERIWLKVTALMIALLLWLVVGARQPTERHVPVQLIPELDSSLVLLGERPRMRALVSGRASSLARLYAMPPVLRRTVNAPPNAPDTVVLDVSPGDVRIPSDLKSDVRVLDIEPRSVTLRVGVRATRPAP